MLEENWVTDMILYTDTEFPTSITREESYTSERQSSNELQYETRNELEINESPSIQSTWLSVANRIPDLPSMLSPTLLLIKNLDAYRYKPEEERWPCAVWPNIRAFEDAYIFIQHLDLGSIPMPIISLADDGEVNFLWKYYPVHVDLGFYGTGNYSYFACHNDGRELIGDVVPAGRGLVPEIIQLFLD